MIFGIKSLLPSELKNWLKLNIIALYKWITRTNDNDQLAFLINTIILGIIILFYILLDRLLKGKFKKIKTSILKHMRENLQGKKVGNTHG